MRSAIFIFVCTVAVTMAASAETTTKAADKSSTAAAGGQDYKAAASAFWNQLTLKQQDCLKEKWQKDKEGMKAAMKNCKETQGGIACVKAVPQLKECFAWVFFL